MVRDNFAQENHSQPPPDNMGVPKIWEMEEELELLREQVNSLKQALSHENQITNYYIAELEETKRELELMNEELNTIVGSNNQSVNQTQEFDKNSIENNTSISEPIDGFLSGSADCCPVEVNEFEPIDRSTSNTTIHEFIIQSRTLRTQLGQSSANSREITARSAKITAQSYDLIVTSREIRVRSYKLRNRFSCDRGETNVEQNSALSP
jgi:hypothetical protein